MIGKAEGWADTLELLQGLFPSAEITQEQYDIWRDDLASMNQEDVRIAIKQHWREKNWKTPKLQMVKSIIYQIKENRAQEFVSSDEDRSAQEYEKQQIRWSNEATLERLKETPVATLLEAAERARIRFGMLLSSTTSGDDPTDWSIMFRAAVVYVMDDRDERNSDVSAGGLATQQGHSAT